MQQQNICVLFWTSISASKLSNHQVSFLLITGDKDLLMIKRYASSEILSPRQFCETAKKQTDIYKHTLSLSFLKNCEVFF